MLPWVGLLTNIPFPPIAEMIDDIIQSEIRIYPCHTNRLSMIGACLRKQYYSRTAYEYAIPVELGLQKIFELGNEWERSIFNRWIMRLPGVILRRSQIPLAYREYQISGSPDYEIEWEGRLYVIDGKSASSAAFRAINTWEDLYYSDIHYRRCYVYQLQGYMLLSEIEQGFFWFGDKESMRFKVIPMELDYDIANEVLERAKIINKAVEAKEAPERIEYSRECVSCQFRNLCKPEKPKSFVYDLTSPEAVQLLQDWWNANEARKTYESLNESVKELCRGVESGVCGPFHITGKEAKDGSWRKNVQLIDIENGGKNGGERSTIDPNRAAGRIENLRSEWPK